MTHTYVTITGQDDVDLTEGHVNVEIARDYHDADGDVVVELVVDFGLVAVPAGTPESLQDRVVAAVEAVLAAHGYRLNTRIEAPPLTFAVSRIG